MTRIFDFVNEGLGHSSYLIDLGDGTAALIDPPRFPTAQRRRADDLGLILAWTADTHSHADYVTGSPGLASSLCTIFVAPALSRLETPHRSAIDGDPVSLGNDHALVPIATPGHTPDHHAYLLEHSGTPVALFTGGTLMVGTVGRTDLCGPDLAEPLAHEMFHSLRRFDHLPDDLAVYPTHGAGSFCGAPGASERTTTLGAERAGNPLFSMTSEDEFVDALLSGFGTFPSYFARLPELNRQGPAPYAQIPALGLLDPEQVADHMAQGELVLDARPMRTFAASHIARSVSNTLRPAFASWVGWLTEPDRPLVFILEQGQDREDLVRQCLDVGVENLVGELEGGIAAWTDTGRPVAEIPVVDSASLGNHVIDVRQQNEYHAGHIPGAVNVELGVVAAAPLATDPATIMCGHGERAMTAASMLNGRHEVSVFDGGPDTWSAATGRKLVSSS